MTSAPSQEPRALRADARRNRERIIAVAKQVFATYGLEAQMDDVAAKAGVGVGTVYRHFPTKEALMGEMVRQKFALILEHAREGLDQEGEPFEVFANVLRRNCEVTAKDAGAQHALRSAGEEVWAYAAEVRAQLDVVIQVLIDRAQQAGTMRPDFSSADMPMVMCGVSASMAEDRWEWRRHLDILLDGLRVR